MANIYSKLIFFSLILLAVGLETVSDILFKKWSLENRHSLFIIGLAIYLVGTAFWAFSLKYDYLSRAISVFTILNLILVGTAGIIIFHENLSLINKFGILLGIISIILIEI